MLTEAEKQALSILDEVIVAALAKEYCFAVGDDCNEPSSTGVARRILIVLKRAGLEIVQKK